MNGNDDRRAAAGMHIGMCVFMLLFAIFWCITTLRMGAWFMTPFGLLFVGLSVWRIWMCVKLMRREKDGGKNPRTPEREPWDRPVEVSRTAGDFCPYCGASADSSFQYCPKCGRQLPK